MSEQQHKHDLKRIYRREYEFSNDVTLHNFMKACMYRLIKLPQAERYVILGCTV